MDRPLEPVAENPPKPPRHIPTLAELCKLGIPVGSGTPFEEDYESR